MNSDDEEHSESEFYYPTEDFTFPVANKNEVLVPESAMESETSLTSPEEFRKKSKHIIYRLRRSRETSRNISLYGPPSR